MDGRRRGKEWSTHLAAGMASAQGNEKALSGQREPFRAQNAASRREKPFRCYLGGAGVKPSRRCPGSGFGLGFGAFLTSFLPLSLLPMGASVP